MPETYKLPVAKLSEIVRTIFKKEGLSEEDAAIMADNLLDANCRGMDSHGVLRVENYVKRIHTGGSVPNAEVKLIRETPVSAVLDGGDGLGAVVSTKAADLCRAKAEKNGIAAVAIRNSNHYGTSAYYCEKMAGKDMIAFSCSNVEPLMAPPGATRVAIGNNPFCMAAPCGKYGEIISDMATSQVAWGKVLNYRLLDKKLPGPWGIDENGNATDDPHAAKFLAPMGLHKGYGIAVLLEILSSLLSGGVFGDDINSMYGDVDKPNKLSHFFLCMKVELFRDLDEFNADMERFYEFLHSITTADGGRIIVPGELEAKNKKHNNSEGITVTEALAKELLEMAYDDFNGDIASYIQ